MMPGKPSLARPFDATCPNCGSSNVLWWDHEDIPCKSLSSVHVEHVGPRICCHACMRRTHDRHRNLPEAREAFRSNPAFAGNPSAR